MCNFQVIFNHFSTNCTTLAMNAGPLSDSMVIGIPNQGMISFRRSQATSGAFSAQVGKASTHPENTHTKPNRYLQPRTQGSTVKSTTTFSNGAPPTPCIPGQPLAPGVGYFVHMSHTVRMFPGLCWQAEGCRGVGPV